MSNTRMRPRLVNVRVIAWNDALGLYGIACDYDDGVIEQEPWGSLAETEYAAELRRRDILAPSNLRRA
jgi:hypothetical protein